MLTILTNALRALAARYGAWQQRQRAFAELSALDDRSLADIGISRAEIPYVLSHARAKRDEKTAQPVANRNLRHAA